jgi:hypothetical protein
MTWRAVSVWPCTTDPVTSNVERASKLLDVIINETINEIFVMEAGASAPPLLTST